MTIKNLSAIPFDEIVSCFLEAFENYYVKMPTEPLYYEKRWKAAKVDFGRSYGMFDKGKLIGFIIHAIERREGILTAFNTGTGVIPQYRGRRIVKSIYQVALKELAKSHIEKCSLEVITQNTAAIKAYESIGFRICKGYKCFAGDIAIEGVGSFELEEVEIKQLNWDDLPNQSGYSWDFQKETILRGQYRAFKVWFNQVQESYFILNSENLYLAQFDVLRQESLALERLFLAIKQISSTIKVINVDTRFVEKLDILERIGLKPTVDQYEMELRLLSNKNVSLN